MPTRLSRCFGHVDAVGRASCRRERGQSVPSPFEEPLRPDLVVEVRYEHMEGDRFRHTAQFNRWRPDRDPESCTYEQLEEPVKFDLSDILTSHD